MSQGPLCPNLTKKVQKEVSKMANHKLSCAMLYRWFKCKLKPPKNQVPTKNIKTTDGKLAIQQHGIPKQVQKI